MVEVQDIPVFSQEQMLTAGQQASLVLPVTELEIRNAVFSMGRGRSPGIDGVTGTFFQGFWRTVRQDVCDAVLQFFHGGVMPGSWKHTLIVLIPKKDQPRRSADYRPISLCTTAYKIIAKILVSRLKPVLPFLISQEQGAFVPGRQISDNVLLAQEAINRLRTQTSPLGSMAIKIDMEQAYDRMEWKCLAATLRRFGFPDLWINWVMACVEDPIFFVLANGDKSTGIKAFCGLRQGCPLSPYLFILCSELLSAAFRRGGGSADPLGIRCSPSGPLLSHLLYADDILVLAKADFASCSNIKRIFYDYGRWTGQTVNVAKCCVMFSKGVPCWKSTRLAKFLGCRKASEFSYLGVTLKMKALRSADFDHLVQQVHNKLHGWGVRHLSMAGRVTLINSVLLMGPVYLLSHCPVPCSVIQLIEKAARSFLWHGSDHSGMHYIPWHQVCKPKASGGLGIHGLLKWRPALLARHSFRFVSDERYLLKECMVARYGHNLCHNSFKRADSSPWKLLCWGYAGMAKHITWEVASGSHISCISDRWIHGRRLSTWPTFVNCDEDFPELVSELINSDGSWNADRLQTLCGSSLADFIAQVPIRRGAADDRASMSNRFSGCSISSFVYRMSWVEEEWDFGWLWKLGLGPKPALFWWRACSDALPTLAWLHRRGLGMILTCPWGCNGIEDLAHSLIHCGFLREVRMALVAWGFFTPGLNSIAELFGWLKTCALDRSMKPVGSLYCSMVYYCWMNRLAKAHNRHFVSPLMAASLLIGNLSCGSSSPLRYWDTTVAPRGINPLSWCPPPFGWLKANFDGALLPCGLGGCATVIRDHLGKLVVARGTPLCHWDAGLVELEGFKLLKDILRLGKLEMSGLIIEGDCVNVIKHLRGQLSSLKHGDCSLEARDFSFLLDMQNVIIKHVYRESNKCADLAAHMAVGREFLWGDVHAAPSCFCTLLDQESPFVYV